MVWLVVVCILMASFTASLTSMLTVQRLEPKVTDIESLKRSNSMVGCNGDSFVVKYLEEVLRFKPDKIKKIRTSDDYPEELSSGKIAAAFLEIPYLKVYLAKYCKGYTTTGSTYRFGGFGFVFPKGSPLADDISKAILILSENGKLKELEEKLISSSSRCSSTGTDIENERLSIDNFWVLFVITGGTSTIVLLLFFANLIRKFRRHRESNEGNTSPRDESIWKQTVTLARYYDKGQLHPSRRASIPTTADEDDWSVVEFESEQNTPEHPQSSPLSVEETREGA